MDDQLSAQWFDPLFRTDAMRRVFSDTGRLQGILDFEAALARAEARAGVIPDAASNVIAAKCRAEYFALAGLSNASAAAGNSAIPVIKELTRIVAASDPAAAQFVHWGATSQDAMDTGLALQVRSGLKLLETDLQQLCGDLKNLAIQHKETPMAGRTWLQHAAPTTFGLKAAGWLCAIAESANHLRSQRLALQFGGPVGTLAALGNQAEKTAALLAEELSLPPAGLPWHSQRHRIADLACALGVLVGSLGKIARDISLMAQTEVAELAEHTAPGRGGSSSMPQKRNPVGCAAVLATATRIPGLVSTILAAMPQEHERALGGWQAEWETLPEIFMLTAGALANMRQVITGLHVDTGRMRANLELTKGQIYAESISMALSRKIGHAAAHTLVERACRLALEQYRHLRDVIVADVQITDHLTTAQVSAAFDPQAHVQVASRLVDHALAAANDASSSGGA